MWQPHSGELLPCASRVPPRSSVSKGAQQQLPISSPGNCWGSAPLKIQAFVTFKKHLKRFNWESKPTKPDAVTDSISRDLLAQTQERLNIIICLDLEDFHQQISIFKGTSTLSKLVLPMVQYPPEGKLKRTSNFFLVFIESCLYTWGTGALMLSQVNPNKPCSSANKQFNSLNLNYNTITH